MSSDLNDYLLSNVLHFLISIKKKKKNEKTKHITEKQL